MRIHSLIALPLLILSIASPSLRAAGLPKRVLVVSVTTGFRHSSIPTAEKAIGELAKASGAFTVDYVEQPSGGPEQFKQALLKLSPDSLRNYDAVIFCSTTGDLPIPDKAAFLDWIKQGHAFIGIHAASDTFHGWPEYIQMIGGEFLRHGPQVPADVINMDPSHAATKGLPAHWAVKQEEIYNFKNYDSTKVHELLTLDKSPLDGSAGHFPVAWCKNYGMGRVFYISFGHREDLWDTDPKMPGRINPPETAVQFRQIVLGGIEWALGLAPGNALPQAH